MRRGKPAVKGSLHLLHARGAEATFRLGNPSNREPESMDIILGPLITVVEIALDILKWMVIVQALMSWLIAFNVINTRNRVVYMIGDFLDRVTEPLLRPIRQVLPNFGGIDLSPVVLLLAIVFIQNVLARVAIRYIGF